MTYYRHDNHNKQKDETMKMQVKMYVEVFINGILSHVEPTEIDENDLFSMARFERIQREAHPKSDLRFVWVHERH